jgi:catechol 2,3-dioxygenase-like lactoylglutathione lyase family enzyme
MSTSVVCNRCADPEKARRPARKARLQTFFTGPDEHMSGSVACRTGLLACLVLTAAHAAEPLPIQRLAGATFQVQDLEKARQYYGGMLGYPDSSKTKDKSLYRLNDDQFLEFSAGAPENFRLQYITMLTPDPDKLAVMLQKRGVTATKSKGYISIHDPEQNEIRFMRAVEGQGKAKPGGFSNHLLHIGVNSDHETESMALYRDTLGFTEQQRGGPNPTEIRWIIMNMPATPGDYMEIMIAKAQPPNARRHICFEVTDTAETYKVLTSRGMPANFKPFAAQNHRMILNLKDPNGLRVEIMGEATTGKGN